MNVHHASLLVKIEQLRAKRAVSTSPDKGIIQLVTGGAVKYI